MLPRKVSAHEPNAQPMHKSEEAEHLRRQLKGRVETLQQSLTDLAVPPGGEDHAATVAGMGVVNINHTLGATPNRWIIYNETAATTLGVTATSATQVTVTNGTAAACTFRIYLWIA